MANNLDQLLDIMAQLRTPTTGCPWDLEQTFLTIAPYTIEEAYEVADAIEQGDMGALRDELGDLLFQVVFHARMAEEAGHFDFAAVVQAIADKMVRRHPHVFGDDTVASANDQTDRWEEQKARERAAVAANKDRPASALDNVPKALPALTRAEKIGNRAARVGFDWPDTSGVFSKIDEEINEVRVAISSGDAEQAADEVGDLLFAVTNLARHLGTDPEASLRRATAKFDRRFREVEKSYAEEGRKLAEASLEELETRWQLVKKNIELK
jgi:nucleoside triphosphate diphosphatase